MVPLNLKCVGIFIGKVQKRKCIKRYSEYASMPITIVTLFKVDPRWSRSQSLRRENDRIEIMTALCCTIENHFAPRNAWDAHVILSRGCIYVRTHVGQRSSFQYARPKSALPLDRFGKSIFSGVTPRQVEADDTGDDSSQGKQFDCCHGLVEHGNADEGN